MRRSPKKTHFPSLKQHSLLTAYRQRKLFPVNPNPPAEQPTKIEADSREHFAFNSLPWALCTSILKCVNFAERLVLLKCTRAIRKEILRQGAFPKKVDEVNLDFSKFRLENGKLLAEALFIEVCTGSSRVTFGQQEFRSPTYGPFYDDFRLLTPSRWRLFQKITPKLLTFESKLHQVDGSLEFDVFKFLPKVNWINELFIAYVNVPENVVDAFFGNFPTKFVKTHLRYLPRVTRTFEDSFVKHYDDCQTVTLMNFSCEELWATLQRMHVQCLENLLPNLEQMLSVLNKSLKEGLPLLKAEAEMVFWVNATRYSHQKRQTVENFPEILRVFRSSADVLEIDNIPEIFTRLAKNRLRFIEEHLFTKNIGGVDHVWKLAKDNTEVFVFFKKLVY